MNFRIQNDIFNTTLFILPLQMSQPTKLYRSKTFPNLIHLSRAHLKRNHASVRPETRTLGGSFHICPLHFKMKYYPSNPHSLPSILYTFQSSSKKTTRLSWITCYFYVGSDIFSWFTVWKKPETRGRETILNFDHKCQIMGRSFPHVGLPIAWTLPGLNKQTPFYHIKNLRCGPRSFRISFCIRSMNNWCFSVTSKTCVIFKILFWKLSYSIWLSFNADATRKLIYRMSIFRMTWFFQRFVLRTSLENQVFFTIFCQLLVLSTESKPKKIH